MRLLDPALFARLSAVAEAHCHGAGPAHDWQHVSRVVRLAERIGVAEQANLAIAVPAALLHELFNYPKDHPDSARSGEVCAEHAAGVLTGAGCPALLVAPICAAIRTHAWSRGLVPETLEGRILQDADRLDAIGAIGVARCFSTAGETRRALYSPVDPFCRAGREADDHQWALDHFFTKLQRLAGALHTETARALAAERTALMTNFLRQLEREIG